MRISIVMGFFLPVPPLAGGATEKIWLRLGELMSRSGHDVTIVSRRWPGLPHREHSGRLVHLRLPGMRHTRWLPVNLLLDLFWGLKVLWALPKGDIVVCNTVSLPVYLPQLRPSAGRVAVVLGRMPKGQNRLYGNVHSILATSAAVAHRAREENPRLASRIFRFPNPVDWHQLAAASRQGANGQPLTLAYVGRIHPEKGLEQLLEAAVTLAQDHGLPRWRLRLIGPVTVAQGGGGEAYRAALAQKFAPMLGERLSIEPPIFNPEELAAVYGRIDVFCYPSLAAQGEGLSIAPIEAMAAGAVPVVSELDCYRDLIVPGENGLQFGQTSPNAVHDLTELLRRLLTDDTFRRQAAKNAQVTARRFDYAVTAEALLSEFARLTATPGHG